MNPNISYLGKVPWNANNCKNCWYPFGMLMPNRSYTAPNAEYRFGFNGMESDNEIIGQGNSYTTHFRPYNPRLGRWFSTDPVIKDYESPYSAFINNPILFTDPRGDDPPEKTKKHLIQKGETLTSISKKHDVSIKDLVEWNKLDDPDKIMAGDELNISDPSRWQADGNGNWTDRQNPGELWRKTDLGFGEEWVDMNMSYGDWYEKKAVEKGESWLMNQQDVQGLKDISVEMVTWGFYAYGGGNKLPKVNGSGVLVKAATPLTRQAYVRAVQGLKKSGETLLKQGYSKENVAIILNSQRRALGKMYKDVTPAKELEKVFARNMKVYGDKYGPTVKWLREQGKTWDDIIEAASRSGGKDLGY